MSHARQLPPPALATRHLYDPQLPAGFSEDLCEDHAQEALAEDELERLEVSTAPPGTPCMRCQEAAS